MKLQAITLSVDPALACELAGMSDSESVCAFCGAATGHWAANGYLPPRQAAAACALCSLPQHLERPRIDEEATVVWLPEVSQAALNATTREIHVALQALGEDVHADAVFRTRAPVLSNIYYARTILAERRIAAESLLGTTSPRELGHALLELTPAAYSRRGELLAGLRLLPLGRFFEDDKDVYPMIVGFWRRQSAITPTVLNGAQ